MKFVVTMVKKPYNFQFIIIVDLLISVMWFVMVVPSLTEHEVKCGKMNYKWGNHGSQRTNQGHGWTK